MGEEQQKWVAKLLGFDFEIRYKAGKVNHAANALSRKLYYSVISNVTFQDWEGLEDEVWADDKLKSILQGLIYGSNTQQRFELKGGHLYYKGL